MNDKNFDIKEHKPLMTFKGREVPEKLISGKFTGLYINMYNKKNHGADINNANYEDVFNWIIEQLTFQDDTRATTNRVNNFSDFMQKSLDHYDYHSTPKPLSVELPDTSGEDTPKSPTVHLPDNTDKPGFFRGWTSCETTWHYIWIYRRFNCCETTWHSIYTWTYRRFN